MIEQLDGCALGEIEAARKAGDARALMEAFGRATEAARPMSGLADLARDCLGSDLAGIRNAGALALLDLKAPGAGASIREALRRPGVAAQSGTLVYALLELDEKLSPAEAALVARDGSHEARMEMVEMMREGMLDISDAKALPGVLDLLDDLSDDCGDAGAAASEVVAALERMGAGRRRAPARR